MGRERLESFHFYEREWDSYEQLNEEVEYDIPDAFNVAEYFCDRWATDHDRVAIYGQHEDGTRHEYTYRELADASNALAAYLAAQGVAAGDRVGLNLPQRPETVIAHLATWKLGAISVPLSTLFGTDALRYRLNHSGATACIVDTANVETYREIRPDVESLSTTVTLEVDDDHPNERSFTSITATAEPAFDVATRDRKDTAMILYTSGSTGNPKGVVLAQEMFLGYLPTFVTYECNMIVDDNRHWTPAEWAWSGSLFTTVIPPLFYGNAVAAYTGGKFDPEVAFELIEEYELTNCHFPPAALQRMQHVDTPEERFDLDSVRVISSGGDAVGPELVEFAERVFGDVAVHTGFGQTEALSVTNDCAAFFEPVLGSMGRPAIDHEVAILDPETHDPLTEPDEIGEIAVKYDGDPVAFECYWNEPEKTAAKLHDGWLLTEDLGWRDEDGFYWFKGRKDDVIISAGYKIGPEEIERTLEAHDAVSEAAVVGVPDDERGEVPKAYVVLADGVDPSSDLETTLQDFVRERLAQYEYPRAFAFIGELPKTVTGKKQRAKLE